LRAEVRRIVRERLRLTSVELESFVRLADSQLQVSLSRLLDREGD
jgi:hypothetical protein